MTQHNRRSIRPGRMIDNVWDFVALIRKAPRTAPELQELTGLAAPTVVTYINAGLGEGLLREAGSRPSANGGRAARVYAWVERPDTAARCRVCGCADPIGTQPDAAQPAPPPGQATPPHPSQAAPALKILTIAALRSGTHR